MKWNNPTYYYTKYESEDVAVAFSGGQEGGVSVGNIIVGKKANLRGKVRGCV